MAENELSEELERRREKEKNDAERMVSLVRQNANLVEGKSTLAFPKEACLLVSIDYLRC